MPACRSPLRICCLSMQVPATLRSIRVQHRKVFSPQSSVDATIRIQREDDRGSMDFAQPHQADVGQLCRQIAVTARQAGDRRVLLLQ